MVKIEDLQNHGNVQFEVVTAGAANSRTVLSRRKRVRRLREEILSGR